MKLITTLIYLNLGSFCVIISASRENGLNGSNYSNEELKSPPPVDSPQCLDPSTIEVETNISSRFFTKRRWYITGSKRSTYSAIAKVLLGRTPTGQKELERMCLSIVHGGNRFITSVLSFHNGYGVQYSLNQIPTERFGVFMSQTNFDPNTFDGRLGVNPYLASPGPKPIYLLKTDNHSYAINYICYKYGPDVVLNTVSPFVSPYIANIYKEYILKMKVNPNDIVLLPCSYYKQGNHSNQFEYAHNVTGGWAKQ